MVRRVIPRCPVFLLASLTGCYRALAVHHYGYTMETAAILPQVHFGHQVAMLCHHMQTLVSDISHYLLIRQCCSLFSLSLGVFSIPLFLHRFSPPHVKRKRKLEEMAKAFKLPLSVAEFYSRLFTDQSETG